MQVVFRSAVDVGMLPLTGTTDAGRMREDRDVFGDVPEREIHSRVIPW